MAFNQGNPYGANPCRPMFTVQCKVSMSHPDNTACKTPNFKALFKCVLPSFSKMFRLCS